MMRSLFHASLLQAGAFAGETLASTAESKPIMSAEPVLAATGAAHAFAEPVLSAATGFASPVSESHQQYIKLEPIMESLPVLNVAVPQAISETIPAPIMSYSTTVRERILGSTNVLPQLNVPSGQNLDGFIREMPLTSAIRTASPHMKNAPVFEAPKAQTLPVKELAKQHVNYPVKEHENREEQYQSVVTQTIKAPHLERIIRHKVPVRHVNIHRFVQPILNREVQPVFQQVTEEGKAETARIAAPKKQH
jgi:hypothetical protein